MDDQRILALYWERDERAIEETRNKYGRLCEGIAFNVLKCREDAEECVNDAYLGVWNAIPPHRPKHLMAFVCKVVRNQALKRFSYLHREKRSVAMTQSFEELQSVLSDECLAEEEELGALITEFLRGQKEEARKVFVRRYYFFDSVEDIARRYSFSVSKVKNLLFRTRIKLKDYLIKEGVSL